MAVGHMREYETIYVMRPELDDTAAKNLMIAKKDLIERLGGKNLKVTAMGRRKLAWECKKETRGIYVHHSYLGEAGIVGKLDQDLCFDPLVLFRHTVLLKRDVDPALATVEEDLLTPPVFKEKTREYSDRRGGRGFDRGDGDYDRRSRGFGMDDEDEDEDNFGDEN
jgi:small subunit ribosomal protein S6